MAFVKLYREKLEHNFKTLNTLFEERGIAWGVVTKLLCGNELFINELLRLGVREMHDSRISNLKTIKKMAPEVQTCYIKPAAKRSIKDVIKYADVSCNTELETIKMLNTEAERQGVIHKVIIMIEMGDLREGVLGEDLLSFYGKIFDLPHIEVIGIGTNLNCLHGVMPNQDKLIQLSLYEQLIEAKFDRKIEWVSGGTSVVIPLIMKHIRPMAVNHFRVGEALFFGNDLFTGETMVGMESDVLKLFAEVIELTKKPTVPTGDLGENPSGEVFDGDDDHLGKTSYRAIVDVGLLDVQKQYLEPEDPNIRIAEASSDMLVIDIGNTNRNYKVGDLISFKLKYMGALHLLSSDYIGKELGIEG